MIGVLILVVALGGGAAWFLSRSTELTPTEVMEDIASAMRDSDWVLLEEHLGSNADNTLIGWLTALDADPQLSNCVESGAGMVACDVTFGDGFFYSQLLEMEQIGNIAGTVAADGQFTTDVFNPPDGLLFGELHLRDWVQSEHPELEDDLYESPGFHGIKTTRESGELRMQLLEEMFAP